MALPQDVTRHAQLAIGNRVSSKLSPTTGFLLYIDGFIPVEIKVLKTGIKQIGNLRGSENFCKALLALRWLIYRDEPSLIRLLNPTGISVAL
jgi:hypothetical protein